MCLRVSRRLNTLAHTYTSYRAVAHIRKRSHLPLGSHHNSTSRKPRNNDTIFKPAPLHYQQSDSGIVTAIILVGITIGGALLFLPREQTLAANKPQQHPSEADKGSAAALLYPEMAPQMPPGRPGTLTPEQEVKLREFWQATLKVFGVYDGVFSEPNGTITHRSATTDAIDATEMNGKKEKRKSRLHVFKRHKHDKDTDLESASTSGAETPSNISQLSIADDDDKHGLTKNFKNAIANSAPDDLRKAFWSMVKHDHPDGLLLRFLRARKWDVEKALVMLISTMHWRAEDMHVDDDVVRRGEGGMLEEINSSDPKVKKEGEDFMAQIRMGKSYLHGVDKEGRPVCVVRVRLHKQGEQSEQSLERFTVYVIETARMLLRPPVDTATIIFDMTGFSMANMDYTPVKFMIKCFEANYPECLGVVLVHKAPWIFQGIWTIIRGWLDPVVAGKVHFTRTPEELESFISRTQIPKELGGDEDWSYTYVEPAPSENSLLSDITTRDRLLATRSELVRKYEGILLDWIYAGDREEAEEKAKTPEAVRGQRDAIAEELRKNYWELDPYLRARSFYDRTGILGKNGALQFYPKMEETRRQSEVWEGVENETSPDDVD